MAKQVQCQRKCIRVGANIEGSFRESAERGMEYTTTWREMFAEGNGQKTVSLKAFIYSEAGRCMRAR